MRISIKLAVVFGVLALLTNPFTVGYVFDFITWTIGFSGVFLAISVGTIMYVLGAFKTEKLNYKGSGNLKKLGKAGKLIK